METTLIVTYEKVKHICLPVTRTQIEHLTGGIEWVTGRGFSIPVNEMDTHHILNVIKCLEGHGKTEISDDWLMSETNLNRWEWHRVLNEELTRRQ